MLVIGIKIKNVVLVYNIMEMVINMKEDGMIILEMDKVHIGWVKEKISIKYRYTIRMRREYTGDWVNDKKTGKGTMFY